MMEKESALVELVNLAIFGKIAEAREKSKSETVKQTVLNYDSAIREVLDLAKNAGIIV